MSTLSKSPSALPLMVVPGAVMARRTSASGSSVTSQTYGNAHQAASGIGLAVMRTQERHEMLKDIASGSAALDEENRQMEEILSEEHHMVSNADVSSVLCSMFVGTSSILATRKPPQRLPFRQHRSGGSRSDASGQLLTQPASLNASVVRTDPLAAGAGDVARASNAIYLPSDEEVSKNASSRRSNIASLRGLTTKDARGGAAGGAQRSCCPVNYRVLLEQQTEQMDQLQRNSVDYRAMVHDVVRSQQRIGEGI